MHRKFTKKKNQYEQNQHKKNEVCVKLSHTRIKKKDLKKKIIKMIKITIKTQQDDTDTNYPLHKYYKYHKTRPKNKG